MGTWTYNINESRAEKLINAPSFKDIISKIVEECSVLCGIIIPCHDCPEVGYFRYTYCIQIDEDLFDLFFNSENGYRGMYYTSPENGIEKNLLVIEKLLQKLKASKKLRIDDDKHHDSAFRLESSKIWLAEVGNDLCYDCKGEVNIQCDGRPEIKNERWECIEDLKFKCGNKALLGTKIRIFSAFVNKNGKEFVPERKKHRHLEIHQYGWT